MAKCKAGKCRCYRSLMSSQCDSKTECTDYCVHAPCGDPKYLTTLAPVIYDQIGINLCNTITLTPDISVAYPTAVKATGHVVNVTFPTSGTTGEFVTVTPIQNRPNCYTVTLTNLTVTIAITLYDCCNNVITTFNENAAFLPPVQTDPGYDEDTNPSAVELEIYAPYGITYSNAAPVTPNISFLGFTTAASSFTQGLNMAAMAKILNLDVDGNTATIGLSVYLYSIYFNAYKISHSGKAKVPKASLSTEEDSLCLSFVEGDLLNMNIKPLELEFPKCEGCNKAECPDENEACN